GRGHAGLLAARLRRGGSGACGTARAGRSLRGDGRRRRRGPGAQAGGGMSSSEPPSAVQRDQPLARLTTVRTGGRGEFFARAGEEATLLEVLAWAHGQTLPVAVVGSGSNLLIADEGVRGLVLKLDGELAGIAIDGRHVLCGGGARLPAIAARA